MSGAVCISFHYNRNLIKDTNCGPVELYKTLMNVEGTGGSYKLRVFANLTLKVLPLPASNEDAERLFSKYD